jgi:hypothetical protein
MNVAERTKVVNELERYSLTQAYNVRSFGGSGSSSTTRRSRAGI